MKYTRRQLLLVAGALPVAQVAPADASDVADEPALPDKKSFAAMQGVYLNSGSQHPLSLASLKAAQQYLDGRTMRSPQDRYRIDAADVLEKYARLVNADVDEVTFVQSTTTAEQMFLRALGFPEPGARIVTDTLHFFGSLPLYEEMARQGMKVTWVRERDGRIPIEDMLAAIVPGTRLVALSLVSTINGFQHDLAAICARAHEVGALVYADIIHAVGAVPVDLHASGVDLAAGASYKWLMGEFGLGFLYVRKDVLPRLQRSNYGYYGMNKFQSHIYRYDPPGDSIVEYGFREDATGAFALGTHDHTTIAILGESLDYLLRVGVANIQAHGQSLLGPLRDELPKRGFEVITPAESQTPLLTCAYENARQTISPRMDEAGISITVSRNSFRVSPSVFNDLEDVDRFLSALGKA